MTPRKQGVVLSYILMAFEVLSTLLLTPFILRTLGQAEYGVYKLSVAITSYLLLLDLGVGNAIVRYLAKFRVNNDKERAEKFLGIATLFYGGIALLSVIGGVMLIYIFPVAFAKGLSADEIILGQKLIVATTLNVAVTLATAAYTNALIAYEKFTVSRGASIIQIVIRVGLFVVCLKAGMGSLGLVYVQLFTTLLCRGFFVFYLTSKIHLKPIFKNLETSFVKEIAVYSSLILLQMIATQLNASLGQFLIGMVVASSAVILGIYSVGTQVAQYYQSIGSAFSGVLMPGLVKLVESKATPQVLCEEMVRIGRVILIVLAAIWGAYLVCGRDFIVLWAGEENRAAWAVSMILMTAYMFILTEAVGNQILWAMNAHKEQSWAKLFIVVLNIAVSVVLIKWEPLEGAALGTFFSLLIGDIVVMNIIFVKKIHINIWSYYSGLLKGILPSLLIAIGVGWIVCHNLPVSWSAWIVKVVSVVIPFFICLALFGSTDYEKQLVAGPVKKVWSKLSHFQGRSKNSMHDNL